METTTIDIRPAASRFHTEIDWLDSWHSFSFGGHQDPTNTHHGLLLVSNDDVVRAGSGFGMHPHRDMEIVTWVLSGSLEHRDSEGNVGLITPGQAQRMSAGTGIFHSETNPSAVEDVRLVQMWVRPETVGIAPGYEQVDATGALDAGGLVAIASGSVDAAVRIHQRDATLWVARLAADERITVPSSGHAHVFVAVGSATFVAVGSGDTSLSEGDAARLTAAGERELVAGASGAEVLIWATA